MVERTRQPVQRPPREPIALRIVIVSDYTLRLMIIKF